MAREPAVFGRQVQPGRLPARGLRQPARQRIEFEHARRESLARLALHGGMDFPALQLPDHRHGAAGRVGAFEHPAFFQHRRHHAQGVGGQRRRNRQQQ